MKITALVRPWQTLNVKWNNESKELCKLPHVSKMWNALLTKLRWNETRHLTTFFLNFWALQPL
jgi:hypothetical protein